MPLRVAHKEDDNGLLIDLTEKEGIDLLLHYLRRYKKILVKKLCLPIRIAYLPMRQELHFIVN